jgi:hypothetical protein
MIAGVELPHDYAFNEDADGGDGREAQHQGE